MGARSGGGLSGTGWGWGGWKVGVGEEWKGEKAECDVAYGAGGGAAEMTMKGAEMASESGRASGASGGAALSVEMFDDGVAADGARSSMHGRLSSLGSVRACHARAAL